jgi:hypothetical protein
VLPARENGAEAGMSGVEFVPVVATQTHRAACVAGASSIEIIVGSMLVRVPLNADGRTLESVLRAVKRA